MKQIWADYKGIMIAAAIYLIGIVFFSLVADGLCVGFQGGSCSPDVYLRIAAWPIYLLIFLFGGFS